MIEVTAEALAIHPFLHGMSGDHLAVLADTASDVTFPARHRLFDDRGGATRFWLIQSRHLAPDLHVPGHGTQASHRGCGRVGRVAAGRRVGSPRGETAFLAAADRVSPRAGTTDACV